MSDEEYEDSTLYQCTRRLIAYRESQVEHKRDARLIAFMIYCSATDPDKREFKTLYEFMPLDGDPTAEELEKRKEEDDRRKAEEFAERRKAALEMAKQHDEWMVNRPPSLKGE